MKKILIFQRLMIFIVLLAISVAVVRCVDSEPVSKQLTMNDELGNSVDINLAQVDLVKKDLGIEIIPQQSLSRDTSSY